jgi:uncharacterized protein (TIGR00369 family)
MTVTSKPFTPQPQVNYVAGGPEALFRVGAVTGDAASAASTMQTGPWTLGPDGRASAGSLGVLLDVVLGGAAVANRPPQTWAVSTEIQVDFCTPLPAGHATLSAQAGTIHHDGNGALAQGSVTDEDDRLVAVATQRVRFVPGAPSGANTLPDDFIIGSGQQILPTLNAWQQDGDVCLDASVRVSNPMGNLHGGIALCLADIAGLSAVQSREHPLDTSTLHISYLRPGPLEGVLRFRAKPLHRGRTLAVVRVQCLRPDHKPFAVATVSYQRPA